MLFSQNLEPASVFSELPRFDLKHNLYKQNKNNIKAFKILK